MTPILHIKTFLATYAGQSQNPAVLCLVMSLKVDAGMEFMETIRVLAAINTGLLLTSGATIYMGALGANQNNHGTQPYFFRSMFCYCLALTDCIFSLSNG
jgi:heme/copper-type cytochrome/quinol oxidase subunit 3